MNPESRKDHDGLRLQQTIAHVRALAIAGYLTGDTKYSEAAAKRLRVFFLDTATRMNPNLNYAQAVLGVSEGRSYGIIDSRDMPVLVDAIRLLQLTPSWTKRDTDGMTRWCSDFLQWLLTSKNGTEEQKTVNNHGVFYDEQVASLALFVGDSAMAKKTLDASAKQRIGSQIDSEGKQNWRSTAHARCTTRCSILKRSQCWRSCHAMLALTCGITRGRLAGAFGRHCCSLRRMQIRQ